MLIKEQFKFEEEALQAIISIQVQGHLYEIAVATVYCLPRHNLK